MGYPETTYKKKYGINSKLNTMKKCFFLSPKLAVTSAQLNSFPLKSILVAICATCQFVFAPIAHSQVVCGGQTVDQSCLIYPNETYTCIDGDVDSYSQYGITLLDPALSATTPQYLVIKGKVTFTDSYTFAPGSDIVFLDNDSGFEIVANHKLTLDGCDLHGCTMLWAGIELTSGTLTATNNTFKDAKAAIIVRDGNTIEITRNIFEKNVVGILCTPSNPSISGSSIVLLKKNGIFGNIFKGDEQVLEPTLPTDVDPGVAFTTVQNVALSYPFAGIWVDRISSIKTYSNTFQNFGNVKEGSSLGVQNAGIFSHRSNIKVKSPTFTDIGYFDPTNPDATSNAVGINAVNNTNLVSQTTVIDGTFTNCTKDIRARGNHLTVTGIVSTKSVESIFAGMQSSNQEAIVVSIKDNNINLFSRWRNKSTPIQTHNYQY